MKCLLSFTDIITPGLSDVLADVLAEEYNMPGWARASLERCLGWYFGFTPGNQNSGTDIEQLQVHHPAAFASCNGVSNCPVQKEYSTRYKEAVVPSLHTESSRALMV